MTDSAPDTGSQQAAPRRTPLAAVHEQLGASLTDFAGWLMPLRYGSETAEHKAVRTAAGLFDLSHMGEFSVSGPDAAAALDYALIGEPSALKPGRARYTMICAEDGGVLDDLIVYRLADDEFLVVANAANTAVVGGRAHRARGRRTTLMVADRTDDYALIAIQGPRSAAILGSLTSATAGRREVLRQLPRAGRGPRCAAGPDRLHRRGRLRDIRRAAGRRVPVGRAQPRPVPRTG